MDTEMRRLAYLSLLVPAAFGCTPASPPAAGGSLRSISEYRGLADAIGKTVTLDGYSSSAHEAVGLYFREKDVRVLNGQCVEIAPMLSVPHGTRVRATGQLQISKCATEYIV